MSAYNERNDSSADSTAANGAADAVRKAFAALPFEQKISTLLRVELDMVVNIGKVLSQDWAYVREDVKAIIDVTHAGGGIVKVIFENCCLQDADKIRLCEICAEVGAVVNTASSAAAISRVDR